ncbi:hypothetical protein EDD65_10839 [Keratinibaculum paraultunense]|uniref:Uncharacterized protein n=1 Tax=Keratinibaculum paraultunense TaxID=1278232 RepID=A0A4R3KTB9_9FIRM|nr:hypothetical protein [Keratinibaculum paraultunense]QQY79121.1 hypothetical protein JL105_07975 [Keratinibaculum paraultunense]TCS88506.1 hypothetical protein EDD65_10839 [Keratinibaculum paraultunense]
MGNHRETGFDRKTIKKYIREYEKKELCYWIEPPKYNASNRTKVKLTDEIMDKIDFYLSD